MMARDHGLIPSMHLGVRTKRLKEILFERLVDRDPRDAEAKIEAALGAAGLKLKEDGKTEYLLFLGEGEIAEFASLVAEHWDALPIGGDKKGKKDVKSALPSELVKKAQALLDGGKAVDVALFGRMLADLPVANQNAACQVAHAISTHRVEREFDYFTAVDDLRGDDETGAGMIGQVEFNSATFYRYAVLDLNKLHENLQGDGDLVVCAAEAFAKAMALAVPSGKQNTFAAQNLPEFIGISLRRGVPMSLANAFEKPVAARQDRGLLEQSVERLAQYDNKVSAVYGSDHDRWLVLDMTGCWPDGKGERVPRLDALAEQVRAMAVSALGG